MPHISSVLAAALVCALFDGVVPPAAAGAGPAGAIAAPNPNLQAAGKLDGDILRIHLRAAKGSWQPEGDGGPTLTIEALGEAGGTLSVPGPLIRATEGTTIAVSILNELPSMLRIHGLCTRDGSACPPLDVPAGGSGEVRFPAGRAGTYHYWATTIGAPIPFRELAGALVIDPPGTAVQDRVFVITEWSGLTAEELGRIVTADVPSEAFLAAHPKLTFVINGLSWPATERLEYRRGETVRWRVINLSSQAHPMHLHGFYFRVTRRGDGRRDEVVAGGTGQEVVTQLLPSGGTMSLVWTPEREGNWLFHCHIMHHVSPARRIDPAASGKVVAHDQAHHAEAGADPLLGMAGMVMGITILPSAEPTHADSPPPPASVRRLTMRLQRLGAAGTVARTAVAVSDDDEAAGTPTSPGPLVVLRRGEPVDITVVNELQEPTSIHWHGLELDSVYDGVHGWSGLGPQRAPMIAPGASFVVRITPPRAGTFIYHTHLHDYRQLSSGLYGPIVVTEPGETYDPALDHVVVLGRTDATEASSILEDDVSAVVNGERAPRWIWRAATQHRIRLINITPDDVLSVSLVAREVAASWRPLTKDGAAVPAGEGEPSVARVRIAVGETYDFEYETPPGRGTAWLEVRSASGRWLSQARVIVR